MVTQLENLRKEFFDSRNILEKCTPVALPTEYINIDFHPDEFNDHSMHMQLRCEKLVFPFASSQVITAPLQDAKILYDGRGSSKKVVELSVNISEVVDYTFTPGDTIGIIVSNSKKDVESVLSSLRTADSADALCKVSIKLRTTKKNATVPQHIPLRSSTRAILRDCLDLRSVPKKLFLRSLAEYTKDKDEKNFLISLSSKEGSKLYNEMILENVQTFLDILHLCPSCSPPLSVLIEHLPRLKPRPYSIANSPLEETRQVKIIFSVLAESTGVATGCLANMANYFIENPENPPEINFYFRDSNKFSFSVEDAKADSILIAIGCGVSPFLGFLEYKDHLIKQNSTELGSTWLFVGSKCQESAVHREKLLDFKRRGVLQELYESFSRDTDGGSFKYVQDHLKTNAAKFVNQFEKKNTILYVCADGTKISKSIESCIKQCLTQVFECTEAEADDIIIARRASGKYREDLWL